MSNELLFRKTRKGERNTESFGGRVSLSEFKRRNGFIQKRIALGYTAGELSFLIGRTARMIGRYEQMAAGVRPENADIPALSSVFGEDMAAFFPCEGEDTQRWQTYGSRWEKRGFLFYEMTLDTGSIKPRPHFKIKERLVKKYTKDDVLMEIFLHKLLDDQLQCGYFSSSRSALDIHQAMQRRCRPRVRPVILESVLSRFILKKKICCFKNREGQFRYHKQMN